MKKKILITILVLISFPSYSYAAGACLIKDKSAQVLLDYIKNNRNVVKNISTSISNNNESNAQNGNRKSLIVRALSETEGVFNGAFNFPSFYSYSKYFAVFPILNEIPYEAQRDYELLEDEEDGLMNYLKKINSKGAGNIIVKNPCGGVGGFCDYGEGTVKEILGKLIRNNDNILDLYRLTVMGENHNFKLDKLRLIDNNFVLEIKKHYSTEAINACNNEEGGFGDTVKIAIENIVSLTEESEDGIQKWKDAWQLLIGNRPDEEAEIERQAEREHLITKGINMDYQQIMFDDLGEYDLDGVSLNNNFMTNTFNLIKSNIADKLRNYKEETINNSINIQNEESISIEEIKKLDINSETTKRIQEEITVLYENELPFAAIGDISTKDLRARIIEAHMSLERSIETLNNAIPRSQNICNSQGGGGNCD